MRKTIAIFLVAAVTLTSLSGCKGRDERIQDGISAELKGVLYNFSSYEPVNTTVDSLFQSPETLSEIVDLAIQMDQPARDMEKCVEQYNKAKGNAALFDLPYRDPYAQHQIDMAQSEMNGCKEKIEMYRADIVEILKEMYPLINSLDDSDGNLQGWLVSQRFKCLTNNGKPTFGDYVFLFDKDAEECKVAIPRDEYEKMWEFIERLYKVPEETFMEKIDSIDLIGE